MKKAILRKAPPKKKKFTDDDIRRSDIPRDVFLLLHDLCYDHNGRDREYYKKRAQQILRDSNAVQARKLELALYDISVNAVSLDEATSIAQRALHGKR